MTIGLDDIFGVGRNDAIPVGGTTGQVLSKASAADQDIHWSDPPKGIEWKTITANTVAAAGDGLLVDTIGGPITVTLPPSPAEGDTIWFEDKKGNFATNKLVIARNGKPIMSLAEDMDVEMDNAMFGLVFSDDTDGWRVI